MKYFSRVHYPFATFWIIIGMFLAYIAFYYGNRMTMTLYLEEKDTDASKIYEYEYPFRCTYKILKYIKSLYKFHNLPA